MTNKYPNLGHVFTLSELAAYEAGRDDAAQDIERMLNAEMQDYLNRSGVPRSMWTIKYDNAIYQAKGMQA